MFDVANGGALIAGAPFSLEVDGMSRRCEVTRGVLIRGKGYAEGTKGRVGEQKDVKPGDAFLCSYQEFNELCSANYVKPCGEEPPVVEAKVEVKPEVKAK